MKQNRKAAKAAALTTAAPLRWMTALGLFAAFVLRRQHYRRSTKTLIYRRYLAECVLFVATIKNMKKLAKTAFL